MQITPVFKKGGKKTHKLPILQETQQCGSVLHRSNVLRGSISPPTSVILEGRAVTFRPTTQDH